jgi:hypothetical protein
MSQPDELFDHAGGIALALGAWARSRAHKSGDGGAAPLSPADVHRILDTLAKLDLVAQRLEPTSAMELVCDGTLAIVDNLLGIALAPAAPHECALAALKMLRAAVGCLRAAPAAFTTMALREKAEGMLVMAMAGAVKIFSTPEATKPLVVHAPYVAERGPIHLAAAEVALAVAHLSGRLTELVTVTHCEAILKGITSPQMHPLALYYGLAVLHKFVTEEPRRKHTSILASANVHTALISVLSGTTASGWHATPRGIALHVMAILTQHQRDVMRPHINSSFVAHSVMTPLRAEWTEVLEGGFLWAAALCRVGRTNNFFNAFVAQHAAHATAVAALNSSSVRVSAAAAMCLRSIVECAPIALNVPLLLFTDRTLLRQMLDALLDAVTATDSIGQTVMKAQLAVALAVGLCRSVEHRRVFTSTTLALQYNPTQCLSALRRQIDNLHPSVLVGTAIVDGAGTILTEMTYALDSVSALPTAAAVQTALEQCQTAGERGTPLIVSEQASAGQSAAPSRSASAASFETRAEEKAEWALAQALVAKCLLRGAVDMTPLDTVPVSEPARASSKHTLTSPPTRTSSAQRLNKENESMRQAASTVTTSTLAPAPVSQASVFQQAFDLTVRLSKNYYHGRLSPMSVSFNVKEPTHREEPVAPAKNAWASPDRHAERRSWDATEVERRDLLVLAIPWSTDLDANAKFITAALRSAEMHMINLNGWLQTCPTSKLRRRTLLNDLYVNVIPRIVSYLEFLADINDSPRKSAQVLELLRHRQEVAAPPGSLVAVAARELSPVAIHCGNLLEVCTALSSL